MRRPVAFGLSAAMAASLAGAAAPGPERRPGAQANGCPVVDSAEPPTPEYTTEASRQAASFGAWLLARLAAECRQPADNERVLVARDGDGRLGLSVQRYVGTRLPNAERGSYIMSVAAREAGGIVSTSSITSYSVAANAHGLDGLTIVYSLFANDVTTGWRLSCDSISNSYVSGNTEGSLSADYTDQIIASAQDVVQGAFTNVPTRFGR